MLGPDDAIELMFDEQPGFVGRTQRYFESGRQRFGDRLSARAASPAFGNGKLLLPLQAADLLAYETFKEIKNRRETPQRAESKALVRLIERRFHRALIVDAPMLMTYREQSLAGVPLADMGTPPFLYNSEIPLRAPGLWLTGGEQRGYWRPNNAPSSVKCD